MAFLAPLFLLGAAGVALPVLFHLIRKTTRDVTPFSSLLFLQPSPPRITSRRRLDDWLLLLLRILALLLVAAGFARPLLPRSALLAPAGERLKRTVIVVDRSASMRREGLWPEALALAERALREHEAQEEVALLTFDREVRVLTDFQGWREQAETTRTARVLPALQASPPGWAGSALGAALLRAAELLEAPAQAEHVEREIILISDLQEGSHLEGLQGYQWPKETRLTVQRVTAKQSSNAAAQWLTEGEAADSAADERTLRVRVTSALGTAADQFALRWAGAPAAAPVTVYVPAGGSRTTRVPWPPGGVPGELLLTGDETPFDNSLWLAPPRPQPVTILFAGTEAPDDPRRGLWFLQRAFPKTRTQSVEVQACSAQAPLAPAELAAARLLVLGEGVSETVLDGARSFAESGKLVLAPLASAEGAAPLARLLGQPALRLAEATVKDYALLAQIDFRHPLFAPFADPRFSDFSKIHFWKYRRLDPAALPQAAILARFDSGDPALVQVPLGQGSVMILTSGWTPADSQLALSSKFVPLLQALLEQSGAPAAARPQYLVGEPIPIPAAPAAYHIRRPDGTSVEAAPGSKFTGTDTPGLYTLTPGPLVIPVNLDPAESRTAPLSNEQLSALGLPLRALGAETRPLPPEQEVRRAAAEEESRQKLWQWLLLAAVGVLLGETVLAAHRSRLHTAPAP